jgi:hypothetical protein
MKKIGFLLVIAFMAIGAAFAQNWGNPWGAAQSVTVEGTLQLQNGQIAVLTGSTFYFVPVLNRYVGFIEGLKEGARISVSGYASGNVLQVSQVTINGKSYDFTPGVPGASGYAGYGWCGGACYGGFDSSRGGRGRRW